MNRSCQSCGAPLVVADTLRTTTRPYCAAASVVERPPTHARPLPTFAVEELQGIYVPTWLYSALAESDFSATLPISPPTGDTASQSAGSTPGQQKRKPWAQFSRAPQLNVQLSRGSLANPRRGEVKTQRRPSPTQAEDRRFLSRAFTHASTGFVSAFTTVALFSACNASDNFPV